MQKPAQKSVQAHMGYLATAASIVGFDLSTKKFLGTGNLKSTSVLQQAIGAASGLKFITLGKAEHVQEVTSSITTIVDALKTTDTQTYDPALVSQLTSELIDVSNAFVQNNKHLQNGGGAPHTGAHPHADKPGAIAS